VLSVLSMQAEIDAPQWADLRAEEALAGTIGYGVLYAESSLSPLN
jgi:hypothetical protein